MDSVRRVIVIAVFIFAVSAIAKDSCVNWLVNGEDAKQRTPLLRLVLNRFINCAIRGSADLKKEFVYLMVEGRRTHIDGPNDTQAGKSSPKKFLQTIISRMGINKTSPELERNRTIEALLWDSDIGNLSDAKFDLVSVKQRLAQTLDYLYNIRYAFQSGRTDQAKYRRQDADKAFRTTRFTTLANDEVIAHAQVEISRDRRSKLNFQDVLEEVPGLEIRPDEVIGEFERFELIREKDLQPETLETMKELGVDRDLLFYRTMQKPLSWMNHDVAISRLFYYCSKGMSRLLERSIPWLHYVKKHQVRAKGSSHTEVLYELSAMDLRFIEGFLMTKMMEHYFLEDLPYLQAMGSDVSKAMWKWSYWPNEQDVLDRMYVTELSMYSRAFISVRDALRKYFEYRKEHDIIPSITDFVDNSWDSIKQIKENLLLILDGHHAMQLQAVQDVTHDPFVGPLPKSPSP